jgi:hypothetical protein
MDVEMRRAVRLAAALVAGSLLVGVSVAGAAGAATSAPAPRDHGFPLDQYLRGVLSGKLFVGGDPPKIVGGKTKDAVFLVDGKAHFQPQIALRPAGRDDGQGRFLVLRARSWGSAIAYAVDLDPGIVRFFRIAFPKAILGRPFPPLYAGITYTFEVAPDAPAPRWQPVGVASVPHPDKALAKAGVKLVTLKKGVTPGNYLIRVGAEVELRAHPLKSAYEAYETVTGAVEWVTIALSPAEVALEKLVDSAIEKLIEQAVAGNPAAIASLQTRALKEKFVKKALEDGVKTALTKTSVVSKLTVPTVVPSLAGLTQAQAQEKLQERFLRFTWRTEPTTNAGLVGRVKSQSVKAGTKVSVGTKVAVRVYTQGTAAPPPGQGLRWVLSGGGPQIDPFRGSIPPSTALKVTNGRVDWTVTAAPQAAFVVSWTPPPSTLVAGTHSIPVAVSGRLTGAQNVQGYRTVDAILLVNDRWDGRTAVGVGQSCTDPIGDPPITCTPPATNRGTFAVGVPTPTRGASLSFGIGALNCGACYVRYTYTAK